MSRLWLSLVAVCACGSSAPAPSSPLAIESIEPACPTAGGTISLTLSGGEARACDAGKIFAGAVELTNLGVVTTTPLKIAARLPPGRALVRGDEVRITCGAASAARRWLELCPVMAAASDAGQDATSADLSNACGAPVTAVIEAVDKYGQPFPRDPEGIYLVPINADDFAFDTGKTAHLSGHETMYTFSSDCYPRVTVRAPVLGGLGTQGLWIDKRCQFTVEIVDLGCQEARVARAQGTFRLVPPP
jgi:hypothetical protein